jgi:AcrR family transcriptional regulator
VIQTFHPTKQRLVLTTASLLETMNPVEINSELVLEQSGVSKGSMYHHFADFGELMEISQIFMFSTFVDVTVFNLTEILKYSMNRDELLHQVKNVSYLTQSSELRQMRYIRIIAFAKALHSERLRTMLLVEQQRLTEALADVFRESQERGWGNPKLDPMAVGVFLQAYTLGRVIDDFSKSRMEEVRWNEIIDRVLEKVIFPQPVAQEVAE